MKRVITYGTFDLLHYGHINLLRRARQMGDYLIVGLSTDEFNWNEKQKKCYFSYEKRKQLLEAIRYVDLVIPEENWEQKRTDVKEYHVDTFVMGDDWKGKFDFLKEEGCEVVYLPRTPEISSLCFPASTCPSVYVRSPVSGSSVYSASERLIPSSARFIPDLWSLALDGHMKILFPYRSIQCFFLFSA
jgi:glycerol-3-phosphate cytidylyltransferase